VEWLNSYYNRFFSNLVGEEGPRIPGSKDSRGQGFQGSRIPGVKDSSVCFLWNHTDLLEEASLDLY
jgi:hypothetical protein